MGGGFGLTCYYLPVIKNPRACLSFEPHLPNSERPRNTAQSSRDWTSGPKTPCCNLTHTKPSLDFKDTHAHAKPSQNPRFYKTGINPLPQPKTAQNA